MLQERRPLGRFALIVGVHLAFIAAWQLWVVVGDAAQVRPQLEKLGMPIEVMKLD